MLGPIARTVADAAFLLSAMAGPDPRAPISHHRAGPHLRASRSKRNFRKVRVAWTRDFGGLPVDPRVTAVLERSARSSSRSAASSRKPSPTSPARPRRSRRCARSPSRSATRALLKTHRAQAQGHRDLEHRAGPRARRRAASRAPRRLRTELYQRMRAFLERYEFLRRAGEPAAALPGRHRVADGDRRREDRQLPRLDEELLLHHHHQPPGDLGAGGLHRPTACRSGIQIVGRYRDDFGVLQLAHAFEQANPAWKRRPALRPELLPASAGGPSGRTRRWAASTRGWRGGWTWRRTRRWRRCPRCPRR